MMYAIFGLVLCAALGMLVYYLRSDNAAKGKAEALNEDMKGILDDVYVAKLARDKLNSDPVTANIVRDQFTRKP